MSGISLDQAVHEINCLLVAIIISDNNVASMQPSIFDGLSGSVWILEISPLIRENGHDRWMGQSDSTALTQQFGRIKGSCRLLH